MLDHGVAGPVDIVVIPHHGSRTSSTPELVAALDSTGLGNHPELVRMCVRIGKAMREDTFHTGSGTKGSDSGDPFQSAANKLYPTSKGK